MGFSYLKREQNIKRLQNETFDLCIIGGGINGAGVARDAVSRGLKVALIEADDFASGTSSRSSKLVHGGIRYLENLEFGLVFEALSERAKLFNMAPHLVHPLRFVLPLFKGDRVGMFKMGLGMWLYDALSMFEAPALHERLDAEETLERVPSLQSTGLNGAYVYSDAYMDDDRLVVETLRSADAQGAVCTSYVSATGAVMTDNKVTAIEAKDNVSGESFTITAKHTLSTVGPWTDQVATELLGEWKKRLRPSKGIHLTFQRERFPLDDAVVMAANEEERIVFGIPRNDMVIVGTTDTDYTGDPKDVKSEREDVEYLLKIVNHYFPGANLTEEDVVASYAGVRPLVKDDAATEGKTSREHVIVADPRNVTFLIGGKYTTYRKMAQDAVDAVLNTYPLEKRMSFDKSNTAIPLNPLASQDNMAKAKVQASGWSRDYNQRIEDILFLIDRHGEEANVLLSRFHRKVKPGPKARWLFEAHHALHETMCFKLIDFYLRRTPLLLSRPDHGLEFIEDIANVFADFFEWSDKDKADQIQEVKQHLNTEMGWRSSAPKTTNRRDDLGDALQTV